MLIDSQRVEASKIKGRYVGDNWKSGLEILVEMMEDDFSLFDETFCNAPHNFIWGYNNIVI